MSLLTVSVFGTSHKENEKRVPIHPDHLNWIDKEIRKNLIFEEGYGLPFGMEDIELEKLTGGIASRDELFKHSDVMLLPKPGVKDLLAMREGSILWGWPHCVQQKQITQVAIDLKLTLIAWEAMHRWSKHGDWQMHTFNKNNELAGYAGVLHAFGLMGINGDYGPSRKAVVLSFGSVSRGAIHALQGLGVNDITIFTQRHSTLVADQIGGIKYRHFEFDDQGDILAFCEDGHTTCPILQELATADVIVNGILQNPNRPLMFVKNEDKDQLKKGSLIIDISCDEGMGFEFAKPTTFSNPIFKVGKTHYYAVDHSPSYLWNSSSWEISNALLPYIPIIMGGAEKWKQSQTIERSIEIRKGVIQNKDILEFQNREKEYPHLVK